MALRLSLCVFFSFHRARNLFLFESIFFDSSFVSLHVWINVYAWPSQRIELIGYLFSSTLLLLVIPSFLVHFIVDIVLVTCRSYSNDFYCLFIIRHDEKKHILALSLSLTHTPNTLAHININRCVCVSVFLLLFCIFGPSESVLIRVMCVRHWHKSRVQLITLLRNVDNIKI